MKVKFQLISLFALACSTVLQAEVKLPHYLTSNMVLQRNANLKVRGTAQPGATVSLITDWFEKPLTVNADSAGAFVMEVTTPEAGGPFTMIFSDGSGVPTVLNNVLSGDVWIASGQSNMEFRVRDWSNVVEDEKIIATAQHPTLRPLQVKQQTSFTPCEDIAVNMEGWLESNSASIPKFSAIGYLYGLELADSLGVPIGIIDTTWGGTPAEAWTSAEYLAQVPGFEADLETLRRTGGDAEAMLRVGAERKTWWVNDLSKFPSILYNAMLEPLKDMPVKGVIWYQGCANVGRADQYSLLFRKMIENWRELWGAEMPFYFVQLAGFEAFNPLQPESEWAKLRQAQADAMTLPATGMATAIDLGNPVDIHPKNKQEVARRLAALALNRTYGHSDLPCQAPRPVGMDPQGHSLTVRFDEPVRATSAAVTGFIVGDNQGQWAVANARLTSDGSSVVLSSPLIKEPSQMKYAWADYPNGNLYSARGGLPVTPFQILE